MWAQPILERFSLSIVTIRPVGQNRDVKLLKISNKQFKLFLLILFWLPSINAQNSLELFCQQRGGKIEKRFKCPKTAFPLLTPVCLFSSDSGTLQFTDGCTGPSGGHRELFTPSCIAHDLCYHHEPATSGKTQKVCDLEFRDSLLAACSQAQDFDKCETWAKVMYRALRAFGSLAYRCDNSSVASSFY